MNRRTLNLGGPINPAKRFLQWKSNDKCFSFYDKEKEENVEVPVPVKFQFLEDFHTVKGWHDASESGIFSNEVKLISKEPLNVRSFKGGTITKGLYKDIRPAVRDKGGVYHRSVYLLDEQGEIVNMRLKGSAVSAYSDFMNENSGQIESFWFCINQAKDMKKGATDYSVPVFSIGSAFDKHELALADAAYKVISDYYRKYTEEPTREPDINDISVVGDEAPF